MSADEVNPLLVFFHAVMNELRRKLTPETFTELLEEYSAEREGQDVGATVTPTPGQTPAGD